MIARAPTPDTEIDDETLKRNLEAANIPSLLPVIYQLTGGRRWLSPPFVPAQTKGFDELDDGGLAPELGEEIRAVAFHSVRAWLRGAPLAVPNPADDEFVAMMSACMGEPISPEYMPMVARQLGYRPAPTIDFRAALSRTGQPFSAIVIGAGISGLLAAEQLLKAGATVTVLEKHDEVGGTWWVNRYPGARVDIPTNLYSFTRYPADFSEYFSRREEIAAYLHDVADAAGVRPHIRFGMEVQECRWDDASQQWTVVAVGRDGKDVEFYANVLITAVGLHERPKLPEFSGMDTYAGAIWHSAEWRPDFDLDGKRVAVVGAGASAMQVVCALAEDVESLVVVQRSPHWIMPNPHYFEKSTPEMHWLFDHVPFYRQWYRFRLYWIYTERIYPALVVDTSWDGDPRAVGKANNAFRRHMSEYLESKLAARPDLIAKCLPSIPPLGKRLLLDNGWFDTLCRTNVELVAEHIDRFCPSGFVTASGVSYDVEAVIFCTGFQQQRPLFPMRVYGKVGVDLRTLWHDDDCRAYLGISTPGFPNLFFLYGPNANPPGGSYIAAAEAQVDHVVGLVGAMIEQEIGSLECRRDVHDAYNDRLDTANAQMVYASVDSYYHNRTGRVVTNFPWRLIDYWTMLANVDMSAYIATPRQAPAPAIAIE